MQRFLCLLALLALPLLAVAAPEKQPSVVRHLQEISVTIRSSSGEGSGSLVTTTDGTNWVLTAGHVIDDLREVRDIVDSKTGGTKKVIEFRDAKVIRTLIEDGRTVGRYELDAEVVRYSPFDTGHDLAVLKVRKRGFSKDTTTFYLDKATPEIGADLYHCGSLLGQMGANSLTTGIVSQHGRLIRGVIYDQTTCTAFPGSSGGGVYLKQDGRYVGMVVRGAGEGFNLIVPIRRIRDWSKEVGVEFILDPSQPVPDEKTLKSKPVEDVPPVNGSGEARPKSFLTQPLFWRKQANGETSCPD